MRRDSFEQTENYE